MASATDGFSQFVNGDSPMASEPCWDWRVLTVSSTQVVRVLGAIVLGLVALNLMTRLALYGVDGNVSGGAQEVAFRFDLDRENTLASWYSSLALFSCAGLLALIARIKFAQRAAFAAHWAWLAAGFAAMSLDESAAIHEISMVPLRRILDLHGFFYFAWVVPGACAVLAIALAYLRFLAQLERPTRKLVLTAAGTFVGGALGLEALGGMLAESQGFNSLSYILISTLEETC